VKAFYGILILVLAAHLQCGGSCLADSLKSPAHAEAAADAPPCHQHQPVPSHGNERSHDLNAPCTQQSGITAKSTPHGTIVFESTALLPVVAGLNVPANPHHPVPVFPSPPSVSNSILRI